MTPVPKRIERVSRMSVARKISGEVICSTLEVKWDERGEEDQRRGDLLDLGGEMLADPRLGIAEPVRQQDRLAVLFQRLEKRLFRAMQGHREQAELHSALPLRRRARVRL